MRWEKRGMFRNVKALILNDPGTWRRGGNHTTTISSPVSRTRNPLIFKGFFAAYQLYTNFIPTLFFGSRQRASFSFWLPAFWLRKCSVQAVHQMTVPDSRKPSRYRRKDSDTEAKDIHSGRLFCSCFLKYSTKRLLT